MTGAALATTPLVGRLLNAVAFMEAEKGAPIEEGVGTDDGTGVDDVGAVIEGQRLAVG